MIEATKVTDINSPDNDIIDIEFKELQKKRFRLDRDNSRVIELNISDISTINRLEEIYPKMLKLVDDAHNKIVENKEDPNVLQEVMRIDKEMRNLIDYAFASEVADKACPDGTLYDPFNGKFRFEYIMDKLIGLYDANLKKEYTLMKKRVDKHTSKYTKKRK